MKKILFLLFCAANIYGQSPVSRAVNPIGGTDWLNALLDAKGGLLTNNVWLGSNQFTNIGVNTTPSVTYKVDVTGDTRTNGNTFAVGNVSIGSANTLATAILNIESTSKGVLLPRLTTVQILAIPLPATGLIVYNTTLNHICFFDGTGWHKLSYSNM